MKISICINTKDRPKQLDACIKNIMNINDSNFELIIIDQSAYLNNSVHRDRRIIYKASLPKGVGFAKNSALGIASGEIVAFTDDDCLISRNWLKQIRKSFSKHKDVVAIFGDVFPYGKPPKSNYICPCIFITKESYTIKKPCLHWKYIGYGNNMAFRRQVFKQVGYFKNWLGPGSAGKNAEDAEMALRLLIHGYQILHDHQLIVYHNRWLSPTQYQMQQLQYMCGEMACYSYYALKGLPVAQAVVKNNVLENIQQFRLVLRNFKQRDSSHTSTFYYALTSIKYRITGFSIALWHLLFENNKFPLLYN